ncbi:GtrA family protein [Natrinema thermotolerans]|uniref:GtrA family protein n=1 Tax=Natrinema thermotolerans TaxID=121872 RepID=A0AAF0T2I6_9EURY|nr:GtrA family protein [Natrinema thermotolerans]QCC58053.1 GtrA family protein [Natrinema thermotolerans]WMT09153.1 GtrA family protein [Natrinema thermotolerans]
MSDSLTEAVRTRVRALFSPTRFGQFAGVGFVGATVDILVFAALSSVTSLVWIIAKLISWELGIIVIFAINERWTFASHGAVGTRAVVWRFLRSNIVRLGGLAVTLAVLRVLVEQFGVWLVLANMVGIGIGFFVNYTCESLYTWQVHQD